jgi:lysozyme family protein
MSDALYEHALAVVLAHEGGYVNDPVDPGGATNFGVSLRWLRKVGLLDLDGDGLPDGDLDLDGDIDVDDIRQMTREDAAKLYRLHWWDRYGYGDFHLTIATKVFDLSINMGARQAHKLLQRACRAAGHDLADDGVIGPITRAAVADVPAERLILPFRSEAAGFYRSLIAARPAFVKYRNGWLRRAYA